MSKTNKELAIELAAGYISGVSSLEKTKPLTPEILDQVLQVFYNAVKKLPDD